MQAQLTVVVLLLLGLPNTNIAQLAEDSGTACDSTLIIAGVVTDMDGRWMPSSMVVNRRTNAGEFVGSDGEFIVRACLRDTLVFGAVGYHTQEHVVGANIEFDIRLRVLNVEVGTAEVIAPRTLNEIIRDIQALGYKEEDFRVSGIDAFQSPITFLYETFAREAKSRREVARLENEDRRRGLLQELFVKYVDYDIVSLDPAEFDAFVAFMDPGEAVLKTLTQYEFILWTRERFIAWKSRPERLEDSDYEYQWDD